MTNNDAGGIAVNPWIKHYQHLTGEEADPSPAKKKNLFTNPFFTYERILRKVDRISSYVMDLFPHTTRQLNGKTILIFQLSKNA